MDKILDRGYRLLSSGEGRKTLLVQSILRKPDLLVLDEPYDSLDINQRRTAALFLTSPGRTQNAAAVLAQQPR